MTVFDLVQPERQITSDTGNSQLAGDQSSYFRWKSLAEQLLAGLLLLPGLPMIVLLVGLVRLTSKGSGIYRQTRVGKAGRLYTIYKIRTMVDDAEAATGPIWAEEHDSRNTLFGAILRKTHLDELPQLFNVIRGEMVLIGPRPERPEIAHRLCQEIPGYEQRQAISPGITGIAQINLPPDATVDDVRRKLILDLEYIRSANVWLDLRILFCTFLRLVFLSNTLTIYLLGLQRNVKKIPAVYYQTNGQTRRLSTETESACDCRTVSHTDAGTNPAIRETLDLSGIETISFPRPPR